MPAKRGKTHKDEIALITGIALNWAKNDREEKFLHGLGGSKFKLTRCSRVTVQELQQRS